MPGSPLLPSPAASTAERLSPCSALTGIDLDHRVYSTHTAPLAAMSLPQLLAAQKSLKYRPQDIWYALVNAQTFASRELRAICESASPNGPLFGEMVTLLTTKEEDRSLDRLADAGVFLVPARANQVRADDAALLRSDEGLKLWLKYAATSDSFQTVFDGSDTFGETIAEDRARIDKILRVLVACGRDRTDDSPLNPTGTAPRNPLSHLCCQIAPQWLRRLLELGARPEQTNSRGMPLTAVAMRAQALRLHMASHDPLDPHDSLRHLARLLKRQGADLMQPDLAGMPSVTLLTLHGLCGAAEALLASGADPNTLDQGGNTLMHHLAYVVRLRDDPAKSDCAHLAHYVLIIASRYGGDINRANHAGLSPRSWLPEPFTLAPQIDQTFLDTVRKAALRRIRSLV
ncbi:hypothetical protein [Pandoraea bronchicola]|uniref:Ankyrin n=1 Tax=Pandoraea bronchicola TaxID=2508287 RepID=A0A5E5BX61_9BURK|nr:hypothetical protein [Pandoraea bronchicola]VVE90194.1 ankyrin [Pandoraea bronchicola]